MNNIISTICVLDFLVDGIDPRVERVPDWAADVLRPVVDAAAPPSRATLAPVGSIFLAAHPAHLAGDSPAGWVGLAADPTEDSAFLAHFHRSNPVGVRVKYKSNNQNRYRPLRLRLINSIDKITTTNSATRKNKTEKGDKEKNKKGRLPNSFRLTNEHIYPRAIIDLLHQEKNGLLSQFFFSAEKQK